MALQADEHVKQVGDAISILTVVGTLAELLPAIAAILYSYRDWETDRKSTRLNSSHRL